MTRKTAFQALVSGMKGQGKTTLTDHLSKKHKRVFVFDVLGEYAGKGFLPVHSLSAVIDAVRKRWKKGFRIAFVPSRADMPSQLHQLSELICKIQQPYYATPDGQMPPIPKVLFIVEEMRWSYPQGCQLPGFATICTLGRHYGVDVIGTTQRIAEISTSFRGTCDVRFFFAQEEHTDITTITKMIGPRHKSALTSLQPHQYLRLYRGQIVQGRNRLK